MIFLRMNRVGKDEREGYTMLKRMTSLFLAALMVLSMMSVNAFAANNGTITVYDATKDATYSIYKLFDLEYIDHPSGDDSYVYTMPNATSHPWYNFVDDTKDTNGVAYLSINVDDDGKGHISADSLSSSNAAEFAVQAKQYAENNSIAATETKVADSTTVTFTGLEHGYYLVLSTASTAAVCMLGNTDTDAVLKDKNYAPLISKWAKENGKWAKANDGFVGEVLEYKIEVIAEKDPESYTIVDALDMGLLTLDPDHIKVSIYRKDGSDLVLRYGLSVEDSAGKYVSGKADTQDYYELNTSDARFEINFKDVALDLLETDDVIRVEYTAKLTPDARKGYSASGGQYNTATLTYGSKTTSDTTRTYTYELPLFKYAIDDTDNTQKNPLSGAEFVISNTTEVDFKDHYMVIRKAADGSKIDRWDNSYAEKYYIDWTRSQDDATVFISDANGKINIQGVDSGTYHFYEVEAPDGYSRLSGSEVASILNLDTNNTGIVNNGTTLDDGKTYVMIENKKGIALPETGGIGTTIFYVAGGAMVLGAAALLITKKRSENK